MGNGTAPPVNSNNNVGANGWVCWVWDGWSGAGGGGVVDGWWVCHTAHFCWHPVPITDRRRLCRPAGVAHAMHCDVEEEERRGQWKFNGEAKERKKKRRTLVEHMGRERRSVLLTIGCIRHCWPTRLWFVAGRLPIDCHRPYRLAGRLPANCGPRCPDRPTGGAVDTEMGPNTLLVHSDDWGCNGGGFGI